MSSDGDVSVSGERLTAAYRELPPRWRVVLWHVDVNGAPPSDLAPTLGLSPDGVAALAARARERLRKAYPRAACPAPPTGAARPS